MKTFGSRGGYSLLELLFTLSLLGTFALIAARLFHGTFTAMSQSSQASEIPMRFDAALSVLRNDISSATSIDVPDPHSLLVHDTAGKTVQWQCDGRHEISRHDAQVKRSWDIGQAIEFQREGAIVLVHPQDSADIAMGARGGTMSRHFFTEHLSNFRVAVAPQGHFSILLQGKVPLRGDRYAGMVRRGFATITALALLSLVGTALATMTLAFASDARRTARESNEAQLRQLLFLGDLQARQMLKRNEMPTNPLAIRLPPALSNEGGQIVLHFQPGDKTTLLQIDSRFRSVHASMNVQK